MKINMRIVLALTLILLGVFETKITNKRHSGRFAKNRGEETKADEPKKEEAEAKVGDVKNITDIKNGDYSGLDGNGKPLPMPQIAPDLNNDFQTTLNEFALILQNHKMTRIEINMAFKICDINSDGALNNIEWSNFRRIFFETYEKCDEDQDYLLNPKELESCISTTREFRFLNKTDATNIGKEIIEVLGIGEDVNFAGYLFMRRTALGWRECVPGKGLMSKSHFICGTNIATMGQAMVSGNVGTAYNIALRQQGLTPQSPFLTYSQFLRICWAYNLFIIFDVPIADGRVTKKEFNRAINDGAMPSKITEQMISTLYSGLGLGRNDGITFGTFTIVTMWFDKYNAKAGQKTGLSFPRFCDFLSQKELKYYIMDRIDSCITNLPYPLLKAASNSPDLGNMLSEKDYIMLAQRSVKKSNLKFKNKIRKLRGENSTCPTEDSSDNEIKPNPVNRKYLFEILDTNTNGLIGFPEFIVFLKYSYSFYFLDIDANGRVEAQDIGERMLSQMSYIPMTTIETEKIYDFNTMEIQKPVDLLKFLAYTNADPLFAFHLLPNTRQLVKEDAVKSILKRIDLEIIEKDLARATMGVPGYPQSSFDFKKASKISLQTHTNAIAIFLENEKTKPEPTKK